MKRFIGVATALALMLVVSSCSGESPASNPSPSRSKAPASFSADPSSAAAGTVSATLLGPDAPVSRDQGEIPVIVRIVDAGQPVAGATVTFEVVAGPAAFPDGFEAAQTDVTGVATALSLTTKGLGKATIRVSANEYVGDIEVEIR